MAPRPNPAPCLTDDDNIGLLGATISRTANTAAAVKPSITTSSILGVFPWGIKKAAMATSTPSTIYLTTLYSNVLGRSPDQSGFNYWLNQLNNNIEDRGEVLMGFSESVENKALFIATTGLTY